MADAKYRFLQQAKMLGHPISADDAAFIKSYEKQKLLVPAATANIKLQGMGTMRQFPVYDNQTKQTAYMDSNEINDAKLREPGPVHGSWLHARSGNPEADRKDVRTWR